MKYKSHTGICMITFPTFFLKLFDDSTFAKRTPKALQWECCYCSWIINAKILELIFGQSCSVSSLYRCQLLLFCGCFKNFSVSNPIDVVFLDTTDPANLRAKEIPNITGREQEMQQASTDGRPHRACYLLTIISDLTAIMQQIQLLPYTQTLFESILRKLKGVCFTVSMMFVVHDFPSVLIDRKNIASGRSHELRFEPRFTS